MSSQISQFSVQHIVQFGSVRWTLIPVLEELWSSSVLENRATLSPNANNKHERENK